MALDHQDRSAVQAWVTASKPFLLHEGSGLTNLALLDLLDAGHQAAVPVVVTWIEGWLHTLLGHLREKGSLEPWKVLVHGATHGIWGLYLHNMPTNMSFLTELPPKSRATLINRANFLRLSQELADLASHPAKRSECKDGSEILCDP